MSNEANMFHLEYNVAFNPNPGTGEITVLFSGHGQPVPEHRVGPQVLNYYLIHYVEAGHGSFQYRGVDYSLTAGQSFIIFPGELVSYVSSVGDPWRYRWVAFQGAQAEHLLNACGITRERPITVSERKRRLNALYCRMEQSLIQEHPVKDIVSGGLLRLILAENAIGRTAAESGQEEGAVIDRQVEQAIRWLTLQYYQPISIENMAKTLGYHRTHLSKMFKKQTGMSPMQYLLKIRMERAAILLQQSLTVEQVASSVGFGDPLYFSKQFKRWYGHSPSEYRQKLCNPYDCTQF